jgi:nitrogen fixation/metabolism regulation signal transduction histidine kinase
VIERAGKLEYVSYYTPVFGANKELMGFLNLPYFARQSALVNEISGVISALINIYVLLFVISIIAGLVLAGYITQPLRIIKQQIANISLGKKNEKIIWNSNDEIGKLVSEYNQMLVKLEESASLLAQSERESAWREMAKQVAHEIKNPLTPMKLNLQYLHHVMKEENAEDFREKFEKSSKAIIEQIDALATIATEFSNLARLPGARLEKVNLGELVSSAVSIFDSTDEVTIENMIGNQAIIVRADREQCLRVFNNLLKNAVQALEGVTNPKITIAASETETDVIITIEDNGCGIDENMKAQLFDPNFTTKSTGSGLGLAMVKNIMQESGGKIWFESEKGKGTIFYVQFPL